MLSSLKKLQLVCVIAIAAVGVADPSTVQAAPVINCQPCVLECPYDPEEWCWENGCLNATGSVCEVDYDCDSGPFDLRVRCLPI